MDEDIAAKKELLKKYFQTNTDFDIEGLLSIFTEDLRADYPSNHNIVGKEAYKTHVEKTFSVRMFSDSFQTIFTRGRACSFLTTKCMLLKNPFLKEIKQE